MDWRKYANWTLTEILREELSVLLASKSRGFCSIWDRLGDVLPKSLMLRLWQLVPQNMTSFGERVFTKRMKFNEVTRMGPWRVRHNLVTEQQQQNKSWLTGTDVKNRHSLDTEADEVAEGRREAERHREKEVIYRSRRGRAQIPSQPQEEPSVIMGFQSPDYERISFCCWSHTVGDTSLLQQTLRWQTNAGSDSKYVTSCFSSNDHVVSTNPLYKAPPLMDPVSDAYYFCAWAILIMHI